jgi:ABC-type Na+ efflux pump permease subunit
LSRSWTSTVRAAAGRLGGGALIAELGASQAETLEVVTTPADRRTFFNGVLTETLEASPDPPAVVQVRWADDVNAAASPSAGATGPEQASAGQLVTWVQITLLGAAEVLVDERQRGTMRRMLVTPAARASILGGKLLPRLVPGLA